MTTTRTRWLAAAAALIAALLSMAAPAIAQTSGAPAEEFVDQWAVGKDWSTRPDTTVDQWAVGKDWSAKPDTTVDQWAIGKDWSAKPDTTVDQWAVGKDWSATRVARAVPAPAARSLTAAQVQLFVLGLLLAAALGGATASVISRHRHTSSAH